MIKKILVANRGEIAVRIIRAARELDIETVAIYSTADKDALHVQLADYAVCVGGPSSVDSYMNMNNILSAALCHNVCAIHPGFGFLSENASFVRMCESCGIKFIGPNADCIDRMGHKSNAKASMIEAGVSVVPGSADPITEVNVGFEMAESIGFPVIIKAVNGGGGRGMRICYDIDTFESLFELAQNESRTAFNSDLMYIEKFIENPRHIEIQVIADQYGNVLHLGERDCTLQRRNQKVIEEAPSTFITDEIRSQMGREAVAACKYVGYENAGTIEFIVDKNQKHYFIEMNTRIQVEHPVTEMITGFDIVKEQLLIASGKTLSMSQEDINFKGHAIECRINAESPENSFRPSPGALRYHHIPGGNGVRFDSHIYDGYIISPFYDSMLGKLIVHGSNREEALSKMRRALGELHIEGVDTNVQFLYALVGDENVVSNKYDTSYIAESLNRLLEV